MKSFLRKTSVIASLVLLFAIPALMVSAAPNDPQPSGGRTPAPENGAQPVLLDPLGQGGNNLTLGQLIPRVINALLQIGIVVIVMAFIYAGFLYVTALGDEKQIGKAHQVFKYTVIGAAVLLGSSVLATAIKGTIDAIRSATQ